MIRTILFLACIVFAGCASTPRGPYAPVSEAKRDTARAQTLTQDAVKLLESRPDEAEALLRQALTADLYFGPAHNNLGVLQLKQGDLYGAAGEFEWARKLMPGRPDPRMNLGLTLELAGRTDEALSTYASALEVEPENIETLQAITRLQLRSGRTDMHTRARLETIALRGTSPTWQSWAQQRLIR